MRGVVISNCQSQIFKHALSMICSDINFDAIGVHVIPMQNRDDHLRDIFEKLSQYDIIISVPLSKDFGPLSSENLKAKIPSQKLVFIQNLYFSVYQPDITYIGSLGRRFDGPMQDYHSKIALLSYVCGLSVSECIKQYRHQNYQALGFYKEFADSLDELERREKATDVIFVPRLRYLIRSEMLFLSVNHPSPTLTLEYSKFIANHLGKSGIYKGKIFEIERNYLLNHLSSSPIWPIYPEIAKFHDMETKGSYIFKPQTIADNAVNMIELPELVEKEYATFSTASREELMEHWVVRSKKSIAEKIFDHNL